MKTARGGLFRSDGRMRGSYVYMLMCSQGEKIHIKVGQSDDPIARLQQIRVGCPFIPKILATAEVATRPLALELEGLLHAAFRLWHVHGEWFTFEPADKPLFNEAWREVFSCFSDKSRPLFWSQLSVRALIKQGQQNRNFLRRQWARKGSAFHDFARHSSGS